MTAKNLPSVSYAVHSTHFKRQGLMHFTYNLKF